jgi:hypothetical protein
MPLTSPKSSPNWMTSSSKSINDFNYFNFALFLYSLSLQHQLATNITPEYNLDVWRRIRRYTSHNIGGFGGGFGGFGGGSFPSIQATATATTSSTTITDTAAAASTVGEDRA